MQGETWSRRLRWSLHVVGLRGPSSGRQMLAGLLWIRCLFTFLLPRNWLSQDALIQLALLPYIPTDRLKPEIWSPCSMANKPSYPKELICNLRWQTDTQRRWVQPEEQLGLQTEWMPAEALISQEPFFACCHHSYWVKIGWFMFFFLPKNRSVPEHWG